MSLYKQSGKKWILKYLSITKVTRTRKIKTIKIAIDSSFKGESLLTKVFGQLIVSSFYIGLMLMAY